MEDLDRISAGEQVEILERALALSDTRLCSGGEFFVLWGCYSAGTTLLWQAINAGRLPLQAFWIQVAALLGAIVFSIVRSRQMRRSARRQSMVQREYLNVLTLVMGLTFIVNIAAFRIFNGWAQAAIWSFAESIVLFYIGMHGNRRAIVAGAAMIASLIAANFLPDRSAGLALAAGMFFGYAGFGFAELLARD
jgi:hypothetical protein